MPATVTLQLMLHHNMSATDCSEPAVLVLLRNEDPPGKDGKVPGAAGVGKEVLHPTSFTLRPLCVCVCVCE